MSSPPLDVKRFRELARDRLWCAAADDAVLQQVMAALLAGGSDERQQNMLAVIANILLVNRTLHQCYFTPYYSNQGLAHVINHISQLETPTTDDLVALYRFMFLILYDGIATVDTALLTAAADCVDRGLEHIISHSLDPPAVIEVLKAMYLLYHKYPEVTLNNSLLLAAGYFVRLTWGDEPHPMVMRQLRNVITVIMTTHPEARRRDIRYLCRSLPELGDALITHLSTHVSSFLTPGPTADYTDILGLFVLVTFIVKLMREEKDYVLVQIFQRDLLPCDNGVPPVYLQILQFLGQLMVNLDISFNDEVTRLQLKQIVLDFYYELCYHPDPAKHFSQFLTAIGYINARLYLEANNIDTPPGFDIAQYLRPKYQTVAAHEEEPAESELVFSHNALLKLILTHAHSQLLVETTSTEPVEMLQEEKEREAEKLMVVFGRLEKTGVFSNPIREWQHLGRFEEIK